ncbi:MAG: HAD-IIB family hydrolase [Gammaproteobacteria bacterium]|jgi:sucrose-phosphate synthase
MEKPEKGLYIVLISVHGLIRGENLELGRDSDTGGQTKYVVELARALGNHPDVERVDLITRQVFDQKVDDDYAEPHEVLSDNVKIIRLPCGPKRYLRKEVLWPHLDSLVDNILQHLRRIGRVPDFVHAHYADAGFVGTRLVQLLGMPLVFTGHSLGRVKRERLLEKGSKHETIESQYNISQRIEAEEITLGNANLVVTSTNQEVEQQYELYDNYQPRRMMVIPPGVDLSRFHVARESDDIEHSHINSELNRFLREPKRPMIFAISRPDERKNIASLVRAYGENPKLQELANLVIVAGNRDDIYSMDKGSREVLLSLLTLIDKYDLYGKVAYPKHHESEDVAILYKLAAASRGVFVNPAYTEPFGLTLIEAAASGVPVVATNDGGPRDIIGTLDNGYLIDPLDTNDIAEALHKVLADETKWLRMSMNGAEGAQTHYSWESHVNTYMDALANVITKPKRVTDVTESKKNRLPEVDRLVICDVDGTLLGDYDSLQRLQDLIQSTEGRVGFGVATGRNLDSTLKVLKEWNLPMPDLLITDVGGDITYGHRMVEDTDWKRHINYRWKSAQTKKLVKKFPGLKLQPEKNQSKYKISYFVDPDKVPPMREISAYLRRHDVHVKLIYSHQAYLDIMPIRASKGLAVRYIAIKWGIAPDHILVAGQSGNDEEMLKGNTLGVVVGNYSKELAKLKGREWIYFAEKPYAAGVQEGIEHYSFLDDVFESARRGKKTTEDYTSEELTE